MVDIEKLDIQRLQYLKELYEIVNGSTIEEVDQLLVGRRLGFDERLVLNIVYYLGNEKLIREFNTWGIKGRFDHNQPVSLTHKGLKEVEEAMRNPRQSTEHFSPGVINYAITVYGNMNNSPIQQGNTGSFQTVTVTSDELTKLKEVISELKKLSGPEYPRHKGYFPYQAHQEKAELDAEIKALEIQSKSEHPNWNRIRTGLEFVKPIVETIAAGTPVVAKIMSLLSVGG